MPNPRASIFAEDDLDVSSFAPKTGPDASVAANRARRRLRQRSAFPDAIARAGTFSST